MKRKWMFFLVTAGIVVQLGFVVWPFLIRGLTLWLGERLLFETERKHLDELVSGSNEISAKEIRRTWIIEQNSDIPSAHPVYLTFSTNAQGEARFNGLQAKRPPSPCIYISSGFSYCSPEYVKTGEKTNRTEYTRHLSVDVTDIMEPSGKYSVHIGKLQFDSAFWASGLPPRAEADKYVNGPKSATQAIIRIWRGHAVVEDLLFDGMPSREYIREMVRLHKDGNHPK